MATIQAVPDPDDLLHVVHLESKWFGSPTLEFVHKFTSYHDTSPHEIFDRIKDADIAILGVAAIPGEMVARLPRLKLVAIHASGTGWVDRAAFAAAGITVVNAPGANIEAVAEHAVALYFSLRRRIPQLAHATANSDRWTTERTLTKPPIFAEPPRTCVQETVAIIGLGAVGRRIEALCHGLGMGTVLVAEHKGATELRPGRTAFDRVLREATVIFVAAPKSQETTDLIGAAELETMRHDALIVHVARGGIVNEAALAAALVRGRIAGAATDVLDVEPPNGTSPLLARHAGGVASAPVPNLIVTPHAAWHSARTIENFLAIVTSGISAWLAGRPEHVIVRGTRTVGAELLAKTLGHG